MGKIRIDSYNFLPSEKILTFHNDIIVMSVVNKNENKYDYDILFEKVHIILNSNKQYLQITNAILW